MHQKKALLPLPLSPSSRPLDTTAVIHVLAIFKMSQQTNPKLNSLALLLGHEHARLDVNCLYI